MDRNRRQALGLRRGQDHRRRGRRALSSTSQGRTTIYGGNCVICAPRAWRRTRASLSALPPIEHEGVKARWPVPGGRRRARATEITTGAMLGGATTPRAFYIRTQRGPWHKTYSGARIPARGPGQAHERAARPGAVPRRLDDGAALRSGPQYRRRRRGARLLQTPRRAHDQRQPARRHRPATTRP